MAKLDIKDKKILYELDLNCRQSFQEIAKKVRLSKESVFYRIKRLADEGVIQRYSTMVDVSKLGYLNFRIFINLQNTTTKIEEEMINYLEKEKIVGWFVEIEGNWDLNIWMLCKDAKELNDFWQKFKRKYINYIAKHELALFTNITYFSKSYLLDKKNTHSFTFVSTDLREEIDKVDYRILKFLSQDARISIIDLAEKVKIHPKTVGVRIKELERKKIIVGFKPLYVLDKIGYLYYKLHIKLHNLNEKKEKGLRDFVFQHPNIVYENFSIGTSDYEIDIQVESPDKLREVIKEIKDNFSEIIQDYELLHYLKEHKYLLMPVEL